jgi:hypothetical protein
VVARVCVRVRVLAWWQALSFKGKERGGWQCVTFARERVKHGGLIESVCRLDSKMRLGPAVTSCD